MPKPKTKENHFTFLKRLQRACIRYMDWVYLPITSKRMDDYSAALTFIESFDHRPVPVWIMELESKIPQTNAVDIMFSYYAGRKRKLEQQVNESKLKVKVKP